MEQMKQETSEEGHTKGSDFLVQSTVTEENERRNILYKLTSSSITKY